jgi:hypothetical protein
MRKALGLITLLLSLFSCGNRTKQEYSTIVVEKNVEETYKHHDTDNIEVVKDKMNNTEAQSTHVPSSSSHSQKSCDYDNMRGFDPASEEDMDDNGMSRYMENNDEEGWD